MLRLFAAAAAVTASASVLNQGLEAEDLSLLDAGADTLEQDFLEAMNEEEDESTAEFTDAIVANANDAIEEAEAVEAGYEVSEADSEANTDAALAKTGAKWGFVKRVVRRAKRGVRRYARKVRRAVRKVGSALNPNKFKTIIRRLKGIVKNVLKHACWFCKNIKKVPTPFLVEDLPEADEQVALADMGDSEGQQLEVKQGTGIAIALLLKMYKALKKIKKLCGYFMKVMRTARALRKYGNNRRGLFLMMRKWIKSCQGITTIISLITPVPRMKKLIKVFKKLGGCRRFR